MVALIGKLGNDITKSVSYMKNNSRPIYNSMEPYTYILLDLGKMRIHLCYTLIRINNPLRYMTTPL